MIKLTGTVWDGDASTANTLFGGSYGFDWQYEGGGSSNALSNIVVGRVVRVGDLLVKDDHSNYFLVYRKA